MGKSFKSRKKARTDSSRKSVRPSRLDSTAGVVLPNGDSIPPASASAAPESMESRAESVPPPAASGAVSEPPPSQPADSQEAKAEAAPVSKPDDKTPSLGKLKGDDSGQFHTFFEKTEEDVHHEEARREAPDLHDPELAPVVRRRPVDKRAQKFVAVFVGCFALLGLAGIVMRKSPKTATAAAPTTQATQVVEPKSTQMAPPTPATIVPPVATTPAPVETAAAPPPAATPAATKAEAAPVASAAAPAPSAAPVAAPTESAAVAVAPSAAPADPDEALTGGQLLSQAKQAINANNASKAAALAKKAIAKGAGGSAYYILGAAYQTMGSNGAAKSAYNNCAKSGCPEAGECAGLVEGM